MILSNDFQSESYKKLLLPRELVLVVIWIHNAVRYLFTSAYVSIISSVLAAYVVSVVYYEHMCDILYKCHGCLAE